VMHFAFNNPYLRLEQKPVEKEITLTSFEGTLNTFLFDFANSPIEDCEPKEYVKKHSAEILKAAYKELNAKLQQDIFEARQEGVRDGYEVAKAEQKPAEWKPQLESLEALMYAIEGKWEMIKPTSYLSRMLEDLYDGLVNTYNVDESLLTELPKTAYTAEDIEELRALKAKIEASMEDPITKSAEKQDYTDLNDLERAIHRGFLSAGVENVPVTIIKETTQDCLAHINKPAEWSKDYREEDLRTRFAFYTYKDEDDVLYLSNVFVEETSRNKGFGTKILAAAEKVAETLGVIIIRLKVKQNSSANAWYRKHGYSFMAFEDDYDWLEKTLEYMKPVKQARSDEDKENFEWFDKFFRAESVIAGDKDIPQDKYLWFKSLRPQPKQEWSEEDKRILDEAIGMIEARGCWVRSEDAVEQVSDFLKSLPDRFNLQPKQEWSEEDSKRYVSIRTTLETSAVLSKEDYDANVVWLRDLVNAKNIPVPSLLGSPARSR